MSSLAVSRPLIEAFNYNLSLDNGTNAGFSRITELRADISVSSYREAGSVLVIKDPNEVEYNNFTLETGVSSDPTFYNWVVNILSAIMGSGTGLPTQFDKRNATLYCFNRDKTIAKKIHIYGAFPVAFVAGEWDNSEDRILIEKLTLAYDYFTITT